jgi:hypothetical protein
MALQYRFQEGPSQCGDALADFGDGVTPIVTPGMTDPYCIAFGFAPPLHRAA